MSDKHLGRLSLTLMLLGISLLSRAGGHDYGHWYGIVEAIIGGGLFTYGHYLAWYRKIVVIVMEVATEPGKD